MNENNEQNLNQEIANQKNRTHGPIYWLVVIVLLVFMEDVGVFLGIK